MPSGNENRTVGHVTEELLRRTKGIRRRCINNSNDCFLKRRTNGTRRKCITLFLKDIQQEDAERLKEGMFGCPTYRLLHATIYSIFIADCHIRRFRK